jgi:hypothetical protein
LIVILKISEAASWLPPCPLECWCHEAIVETVEDVFASPIPLKSILPAADKSRSSLPEAMRRTNFNRNADRWQSIDNPSEPLNTVICIQQRDTDIDTLLARLPPQTEVTHICINFCAKLILIV